MSVRIEEKSSWVEQVVKVAYAAVLLIAGYGQITGLGHMLGWPVVFALPAVAVVELIAVVFAALAEDLRRKGEMAIAARIFAFALAGGAVCVNWYGHHAQDRFLAWFFAGLSATGFIIYLIHSGARRRAWLRKQGKLAETPPAYGKMQWLTQPKVTLLARTLAVESAAKFRVAVAEAEAAGLPAPPAPLGVHDSLTLAQEQINTARRRAAIIKLVRGDMAKSLGPQYAQLVVTIADPDRLAVEIERLTDWGGVAKVYANRVDPARLAVAARKRSRAERKETAQSDAQQRAVPAASERAETRGQTRGSDTPGRARNRAAERAPGNWWTRAREDFYARSYAPELDTSGREIGGVELASGLGVDGGNARRARDNKLRPRYVQEVVSGARQPRAPLPDAIAQKVAEATGGARLAAELERMGDRAP